MRQMSTCQTAANEFLRHYWHSIYPPPSQASLPLTEVLKNQRAAKAAKMAGYLASTHEKVGAIVKSATFEKVDPRRVELVGTSGSGTSGPADTCNSGNETGPRRSRQGVDIPTEPSHSRGDPNPANAKMKAKPGVFMLIAAMRVQCNINYIMQCIMTSTRIDRLEGGIPPASTPPNALVQPHVRSFSFIGPADEEGFSH